MKTTDTVKILRKRQDEYVALLESFVQAWDEDDGVTIDEKSSYLATIERTHAKLHTIREKIGEIG